MLRLLPVITAPLDRPLAQHPNSHIIASNVFTLAGRVEAEGPPTYAVSIDSIEVREVVAHA